MTLLKNVVLTAAVATLFASACTSRPEQTQPVDTTGSSEVHDVAPASSDAGPDASDSETAAVDIKQSDAIQSYGSLTAANPGEIAGVAAGIGNTCVWSTGGLVYCWGSNHLMRLGGLVNAIPEEERPFSLPFPITITGLTDVEEVVAHSEAICARLGSGAVKCWGLLDEQDGYCSGADWTPELIDQLGPVSSLTRAYSFIGGVTVDHHVAEWGLRTTSWTCDWCCNMPAQFQTVDSVESVGVGGYLSCAVTKGGKLWCWGNPESVEGPPVEATDMGWTGVSAVAAGGDSVCALMTNGQVRCFGRNRWGSLGVDAPDQAWVDPADAKPIPTLNDAVAIWGAFDTYCALRTDASLWCWGKTPQAGSNGLTDTAGQLSRIDLPAGVKSCSRGVHTCALLHNGEVWCWGANLSGPLGNGTTTASAQPVKVQFGK